MYQLIKPILFLFSAEKAHHLTLKMFRFGIGLPIIGNMIRKQFPLRSNYTSTNLWGIEFPNRIGLAAGFDKDAKVLDLMSMVGFGFIEIGTLTPLAQEGNPKPRLFRLKKDEALINRMGFNNGGVEAAVERLKRVNLDVVVGGNIGKNKITPNEKAVDDYEIAFKALYPYVDYFVINVSSPNTPGLRELQDKKPLSRIIKAVQTLNEEKVYPKPILLKIAPDLNEHQLEDIAALTKELSLDGLIATNTTIERSGLKTSAGEIEKIGNGGLSGKPVKEHSTAVLKFLRSRLPEDLPIIGVGGIMNLDDAKEKIDAGADLVQIYSGMIFRGPDLIKELVEGL